MPAHVGGALHEKRTSPRRRRADIGPESEMSANRSILVLNAGSSSLKFALYDVAASLTETIRGEIENLDSAPHRASRQISTPCSLSC
jgi:hypothetical protein